MKIESNKMEKEQVQTNKTSPNEQNWFQQYRTQPSPFRSYPTPAQLISNCPDPIRREAAYPIRRDSYRLDLTWFELNQTQSNQRKLLLTKCNFVRLSMFVCLIVFFFMKETIEF